MRIVHHVIHNLSRKRTYKCDQTLVSRDGLRRAIANEVAWPEQLKQSGLGDILPLGNTRAL